MKKIFCILLIITSALVLTSCVKVKIEDDTSNPQSGSIVSDNKIQKNNGSNNSSNSKENAKASEIKGESVPEVSNSNPNINININNGAGTNTGENIKNVSTKQYYLQKLDKIEAGMSDLESLRAGNNMEMKRAAGIEYRRWDDALNEIYSVLKSQLSSSEMNKLEKEEVEWIKYKEDTAKKSADEFKGGTAEPLVYTIKLAEITKDRCYYLVNNYMK